ncbi:unnamed protein product [Arctogadus glacialis]
MFMRGMHACVHADVFSLRTAAPGPLYPLLPVANDLVHVLRACSQTAPLSPVSFPYPANPPEKMEATSLRLNVRENFTGLRAGTNRGHRKQSALKAVRSPSVLWVVNMAADGAWPTSADF